MEKVQTTTENNFSKKGDNKTKTKFKNNNKNFQRCQKLVQTEKEAV